MAPAEISETQAPGKLGEVAAALRVSGAACNCGYYGFVSAACTHKAVDVPIKCGLTLSPKTGRLVFCVKKPPSFILPGIVVPKQCREGCEPDKMVSPSAFSLSLLHHLSSPFVLSSDD